jgi:aminoglycoside phosphotransferase (APT) family kinase protein
MSGVIVAPQVRDLEILGAQVSAWLAKRLPGARDLEVRNLSYPFGAGQSHETILFDASWTADGVRRDEGMVVRIKPTTHTVFPDDLFIEQYKLMSALHEHGWAPVARPFWLEEDASVLGAPFFVMQKLKGRVAVSVPPYAQQGWVADSTPAQRRKLWENGVRQLAGLQKTPVEALGFLKGNGGTLSGLEQEWDKYSRFLEWISRKQRWPVLDAALENLRARWPKNQPAGLVWGDARLGNLMFDDDYEVVAVMDLEQPSLGGALHDLAWWLYFADVFHGASSGRGHLEGMGTREETIALWREVTGISTDDLEWYEDFTAFKVGCISVRSAELKNWPTPDHSGLAKRFNLSVAA